MKQAAFLRQRRLLMLFLLAGVIACGGCARQVASLDENDFNDPMIRRAQSKLRQGDKDGAVACLNDAIEKRPNLAQAHLMVALLYDEHARDYVRAIYHYRRYLELRPAAQKKSLIEDLIRKATMSFAATLSEQAPETAKKIQALEEENSRLKASLREARDGTDRRIEAPGTAEMPRAGARKEQLVKKILPMSAPVAAAPDAAEAPGPAAPGRETYQVQAGDTLSLISAKVYHNPRKWKAILDANVTNLLSPDKLRPGQILVIPR